MNRKSKPITAWTVEGPNHRGARWLIPHTITGSEIEKIANATASLIANENPGRYKATFVFKKGEDRKLVSFDEMKITRLPSDVSNGKAYEE